MQKRVRSGRRAALLIVLGAVRAAGQEAPEPAKDWDLDVGLSYVDTGGNSETSSGALDLGYAQRWGLWALEVDGKAVRASDGDSKTAERYTGGLRGKRAVSDVVELTAGARGEQDRFAGIDFRSIIDAGLLWTPATGERWTASALAGLSWNHEDSVADPTRDFAGGIFELKATRRLSKTAELTARAALFPSLEEASDYRAEGRLSLQAAVATRFALKLTYELLYNNAPPAGFGRQDRSLNVSLVVKLGRPAES